MEIKEYSKLLRTQVLNTHYRVNIYIFVILVDFFVLFLHSV